MIPILLLSLLQLSTAAIIRLPYSKLLELDDPLDSIMFELPENAHHEILDHDISHVEDHPIISFIRLDKKPAPNKNRHQLPKEATAKFKLHLDFAIPPLQTVQINSKKGSTTVSEEKIEKSLQDLKKLEHIIGPSTEQLLNAVHQGLSHFKDFSQELLNVLSRHPSSVKTTTSKEMVHEIKSPVSKVPVNEKKQPVTKTQIFEFKPLSSKTLKIANVQSRHPPPIEEEVIYEFVPLVSEIPVHEKKPFLTTTEVPEIGSLGSKNQIHQKVQSKQPLPVKEEVIYEFRPLITETLGHEKKPLATKTHESKPVTSNIQDQKTNRIATNSPTHKIEIPGRKAPQYETKLQAAEGLIFDLPPPSIIAPKDTNLEERKSYFKDKMFKNENIKDGDEINSYHSKWTWKTGNFVK